MVIINFNNRIKYENDVINSYIYEDFLTFLKKHVRTYDAITDEYFHL